MSTNHTTTILSNPVKLGDIQKHLATSGVYVIHCIESDTFYIGQSGGIIGRLINHFYDLKEGQHNNKIFQMEYDRFGQDSFVMDLLHDMPESSTLERMRAEMKEIQRYQMYHRRLYNKVLNTIRTKPNRPTTKYPSYPTKKSGQKAIAPGINIQQRLTYTEPEYTDVGTCLDCGASGTVLINVFYCDDGNVRCTPCLEKMLDNWTMKFNKADQAMIDKRSTQIYFRWQIDNRRYLNAELAVAIDRFIEKHKQEPSVLFVNLAYDGPSEFKSVKVSRRKVTPKGCLDIPIQTLKT